MVGRQHLEIIEAVVLAIGIAVGTAVTDASGGRPVAPPLGYHSRCPRTDRTPYLAEGDAAKAALVPRGARGVLLCRYRGVNPSPDEAGTLAISRRIRERAAVHGLARQFNSLRAVPPGGVTACPADDGFPKVVAFFHYAKSPDDPVTVSLRGCRSVTNGLIVRSALSAPGFRLLRHIESLTRT
jgi:hypothetical protein